VILDWQHALRAGPDEIEESDALMRRFAERTGLASERPPRRYLWTDAFAVCNLLGLWRATGEQRHLELALALVDQVHAVLGRHREDDVRRGWISGLSEREGAAHPTRGGLRIGKELPERAADAPLDERLEWERDGQYFHYLTRWMHALDQVARWTGELRFNTWARELAEVAQRAFTRPGPGDGHSMVWKMSIDLSRPLVPSMGQHDPLDGLVTCLELRDTAARLHAPIGPTLDEATAGFARMLGGASLVSTDPLGIGGLLLDAARVEQLRTDGAIAEPALLEALLGAALLGLEHVVRRGDLGGPAERRLAFRELGLAIGLAGLAGLERSVPRDEATLAGVRERLAALARHAGIGPRITGFWRDRANRRTRSWAEHQDIDDVMLATALVPAGVLLLGPASESYAAASQSR